MSELDRSSGNFNVAYEEILPNDQPPNEVWRIVTELKRDGDAVRQYNVCFSEERARELVDHLNILPWATVVSVDGYRKITD